MFSVCLMVDNHEKEWHNQWSYVLSHWSPTVIYLVGEPDLDYKAFKGAQILRSLKELPVDSKIVLLQPESARHIKPKKSIQDFRHEDGCIYLFGPDNANLTEEEMKDVNIYESVYIPTDSDLEMYSWVAGAITLYDRKVKNG